MEKRLIRSVRQDDQDMIEQYDVIVMGGGTAGVVAAIHYS